MVRLLLRSLGSGAALPLDVAATSRLRDLQPVLCRLFQKSFPWHRASVVIGSAAHDHFESQPFLSFEGDAEVDATVVFSRNEEDPFFFDRADRRGQRATVLEEYEWEQAVEAGDVAAQIDGCEAWAMSRRAQRNK